MDFGTRLRTWRLEANLSQREPARQSDLNFSYLSKIDAGLVPPPSDEKVRALAAALNRSGVNLLARLRGEGLERNAV